MRRLTRFLPIVFALVALFFALRASFSASDEDDAGYLAYRVPVGRPITFRLRPEETELALTVHLVAPLAVAPLRFPVTTTILAPDGSTLWTGRTLIDAAPGGAIADGDEPLTAARQMSLPPIAVPKGARLRVTVGPGADAPAGAHAVLRLLPRRAAIENHGRATDAIRLVQVRTAPRAPVVAPPPAPPGELIAPDRAAAWTVRGPGRVRLAVWPASGPAALDLATVDNLGRAAGLTLLADAPIADQRFDAPAGGALTITARCAGDERFSTAASPAPCARVRAFVEDGATPLGDGVAPDAGGEITPDRRLLPVWRLAAGDPPLRATLAGDGTARVSARPAEGGATLTWRLVDEHGGGVAKGEVSVPYRIAPFERAAGDLPAGEPIAFLASAPPGAVLELVATTGVVDVTLEAPDEPPALRLALAYEVPLDHARLRHAPYLRRHWVPFRPDDHARLASLGRAVDLEAQVRLEPSGPAGGGGPYVPILPLPPRTRQLLAEELDDPPTRWRRFDRAAFTTGETAAVVVPASGDEAGRVSLDYRVSPAALGGSLRVWLDGRLRAERRLALARGRIRLEGLPAGRHELRVEGAPGMIFTGTPATGRTPWAERTVWRLDRGDSLTVPVELDTAGKTLHVVLYHGRSGDGTHAPAPARATVTIDGGTRGAALRPARGRTRLTRRVDPAPLPVSAVWLDRAGGPQSRSHFAIRLAPDLGSGTHHVRIALDDGPRRAFARFYVTGAGAEPSVERLGAEWDLD